MSDLIESDKKNKNKLFLLIISLYYYRKGSKFILVWNNKYYVVFQTLIEG